jgi:hypothetical protein
MVAPRVFPTLDTAELGVLLPLLGISSLLVSPFGAAIAGYIWGSSASVRTEWLRFTGTVILFAIAGFLVTFALALVLVMSGRPGRFGVLLTQVAVSLFSGGLGLVSVGLIALAGGAIAEFQGAGA